MQAARSSKANTLSNAILVWISQGGWLILAVFGWIGKASRWGEAVV
jgi:hypothetical protein